MRRLPLAWSPPGSLLLAVAAALIAAPAARADRLPTAVLWLEAPRPELARALGDALAQHAALRPLDDAQAKALLVAGGPGSRARERLDAGRAHLASLELQPADAELAEAESIALGALPVADACPLLIEVERLRLRRAEVAGDGPAAEEAARLLGACLPSPTPDEEAQLRRHLGPPPAIRLEPARVESDPPGADVYL